MSSLIIPLGFFTIPLATTDTVTALVGALLGVGGAGGIVAIVGAYRSYRKGRIEDEETIIVRLNNDNKVQRARVKELEAEKEIAVQLKDYHREQAAVFRLQVIQLQGTPNDMIMPEKLELT